MEREEISAQISPLPGKARMAASVLQGLGFRVYRIGGKTAVDGPAEVWEEVFGITFSKDRDSLEPATEKVVIPEDLADLVEEVVIFRQRP